MNDSKLWVALKHKTSVFGEWCVAPKEYFAKHGRIPDGHANLDVPGMEETKDHTLMAKDGSDGQAILEKAGFEILHNPVWYWSRKGKQRNE